MPRTVDLDEYVSLAHAGTLLGVSSQRIRQLADSGRLEAIRTPLGRLVTRESVEALRAQRAGVAVSGGVAGVAGGAS